MEHGLRPAIPNPWWMADGHGTSSDIRPFGFAHVRSNQRGQLLPVLPLALQGNGGNVDETSHWVLDLISFLHVYLNMLVQRLRLQQI
jgi:hypothetical protein